MLKAYYHKKNICDLSDVFPPKKDDFILNFLLTLPWEKMHIDNPIPSFRRGLEIPDYEDNFVKHLPPEVALYEGFWITDTLQEPNGRFKNTIIYKLPQLSYYTNTKVQFDLIYVNQILEEQGDFFIELDGLIKFVEIPDPFFYEKGIYVSISDSGVISVSGLSINHPSNVITEFGIEKSWFYEINEGSWDKINHPEQCPCNNELRHELHFSLLNMLNEAIKDNELVRA